MLDLNVTNENELEERTSVEMKNQINSRYIQFSNQNFPVHVRCRQGSGLFDVLRINEMNNTRIIVFNIHALVRPINYLFSCEFDYHRS